jgi:cytochrome P450
MLLRETLRIAQPHVAMRRNVGPEMYIDGKVIPTGTLVVYPFANVHLNPAMYPDPWKFDPTRPLPKGDFPYLGWGGGARPHSRSFFETEVDYVSFAYFCLARGVGRVACLGSRLATLTIKLLAALVLSDFDFDTVDAGGRIADPAPEPNWNDELTCRPARGQFFLKYRRLDSSGPPNC